MYVKLAFSVAAHLDSEIMIMDEVLAVGDMAFQKKCLDKMRAAAKQQGRTVLYVSHNMNTIRQLCDRCIVLDKGRVVFEGDVEEAIGVYMGHSTSFGLFKDCSRTVREPIGDGMIHIQSTEIMDCDTPILFDNDSLKLKVCFTSERNYLKIAFRVVFFNEAGNPIGMASSAPNIIVKKGLNTSTFHIHFPCLASGRYDGRIVFYEVDEYSNECVHDVVSDAFSIRKEFTLGENYTTRRWGMQFWGNIVFPSIHILNSPTN